MNDYVRYEIEPPADLRDQYDRLIKQQLAQRESRLQVTLANALQQLNGLVTWWNRSFTAQASPKPGKPYRPDRPTRTDTVSFNNQAPDPARLEAAADRSAAPRAQLEEVVVVGYGTSRKRELTGSIATGSDDRLMKQLAGRIPGLHVTQAKRTAIPTASSPIVAKDEEVRSGYVGDVSRQERTSIDIKQWTPERSYLQSLAKEKAGNRYAAYLALRKEYLYTPTFLL